MYSHIIRMCSNYLCSINVFQLLEVGGTDILEIHSLDE